MIKKIIVSLSLFVSLTAFAQEGTSSPYSFYGIGDVRFKGTIENRAMAGLAIAPDSIHLNLQNPAMYPSLKLTTFGLAGTFAVNKFKSSSEEGKAQRAAFDYLAVGLPVNKLGIGFGLMPYSSLGYKIDNWNQDRSLLNRYQGSGGINKAFFAAGYQITKQFSVGAEVQYNFGKIETSSITASNVENSTREKNTSSANGVNFNLGFAYQGKLNAKTNIFSSVSYEPESDLTFKNERNIATIKFNYATGNEIVQDEIDIIVGDTKLKLPSKLTFGTGISQVKKWLVGAQITMQNNTNFGNRFYDINNVSYEQGIKYAIGGYYIPKYNSFSKYVERITYRGGFRYENTGLVINNQPINDYALTFGFGLPAGNSFSNFNIGFEFGKRGTTSAGLLEENYANISIGLSFNDRWFKKSKYD